MSSAVAEASTLETLLAPISEANPVGENLQYSGLHDEIREARRSEENLEQGEWRHETKVANWGLVESLATDALAKRTKDLQIAVWLSEALVKLYGFEGMRDSLKLIRGLLEQYWENIYPEIDEGDLEARVNALSWFDRQLSTSIKEAPVTRSPSGANYSFFQWEEAKQFKIPENLDQLEYEEQKKAQEVKEKAERDGKITSDKWLVAKNSTRRDFYEELYALLNECWQEFGALDRVMDEKFDRQTPGLGALKKSLDDIRSNVEKLVKEKRLLEPDEKTEEESLAPEGEVGQVERTLSATRLSVTGPISTREDALKKLSEVAEFFHKTEPQSPVSYLVERAVRWGRMPLDTWLEEVIKDNNVLGHLRETLGLLQIPHESSGPKEGN
jgi:type VI secretion system protein ImpA